MTAQIIWTVLGLGITAAVSFGFGAVFGILTARNKNSDAWCLVRKMLLFGQVDNAKALAEKMAREG